MTVCILSNYFQEVIEGKVTSPWEKKDGLNVLFDETDGSRSGLNNLVERQTEKWLTDMGAFVMDVFTTLYMLYYYIHDTDSWSISID